MAKITSGDKPTNDPDTPPGNDDALGTGVISDEPLGSPTGDTEATPEPTTVTNTEEAPVETRSTNELADQRVIAPGEPDMNAASTDGVHATGNRYPLTDEAKANLIRSLETEAAELERQAEGRRDEVAKLKES